MNQLEKPARNIRTQVSLEKIFSSALLCMSFNCKDNESLRDTPKRWAKWMLEATTPPDFNFTTFPNDSEISSLVIVKDIGFTSLCEHHTLPFFGVAKVGYIPKPNGRIVGISKLARVVDHFSKTLQVQERLTKQIVDFLWYKLDPLGVGVVLKAKHMCMMIRGVKKFTADTITSEMRGVLLEPGSDSRAKDARKEFLQL